MSTVSNYKRFQTVAEVGQMYIRVTENRNVTHHCSKTNTFHSPLGIYQN